MTYINYGISFLYKYNDVFRLCGICNEPGYLGTFCALILCADGIKLRKKGNIILFIAGLLSFSVAFIVILVVYWAMKTIFLAHKEKNKNRKVLSYILALVALFGYFAILPNIETGNVMIDRTVNRLVLGSDGKLVGDNRTNEEFDTLYSSLSTMDLMAGMGRGYVRASGIDEVSSYKIYVVEFGILGVFFLWGSLALAALYKNTKKTAVVVFVIAFFASIYQRPNVFTLAYVVVLFGGIEYIKEGYSRNLGNLNVMKKDKK